MKHFVFFVALQLGWATLPAQIVRLKTQAEVDNFSPVYVAQLVIGPDTCCSDIHDLSPLANMWGTEIGIVVQNNPHLQSLHGLEQIKYMKNGGQIRIINNDSLPNLSGLADSIGYFPPFSTKMVGYIIEDNDLLTSLQGIPDCSKAALEMRRNAVLPDLNGCQHLNYLYTTTFQDCPSLQNFHGLEGVDTIFSSLFLQYCPRLKNMQGLNNCRTIGYQIYAHRLDSLEDTQGLGNMRTTNSMVFDSCARFRALTDLERLGKNRFGEAISNLEITYCPWFGDFSGLSDTALFRTVKLFHVDSIEKIRNIQKIHANTFGITAYNLQHLDALPWGLPLYGQAPSFGAGGCDNLTYIHDTLSGRTDTMYFLAFNLCPKLADITGFKYVKGVTSQLILHDLNTGSLIGLENLKWSWFIHISNSRLHNLQFLSSLDSVGIFLLIGKVASLAGLENLRTVYEMDFFNNDTLKDLSPVEDNTRIESSLTISHQTNLDSIAGFNLPELMGSNTADNLSVNIEGCAKLKSISGFNGVTTFTHLAIPQPYDYNVIITDNPILQTVTGFQNLLHLRKGLHVSNNPGLTDISGFCNLFQHGTIIGIKNIDNNAPGANSYGEALAVCNASGSSEPDNQPGIAVYPNPASTEFVVRRTGVSSFESSNIIVADLAGRIQLTNKAGAEETVISCSRLPAGIYEVRIVGDGTNSRPVKLVIAAR